MFQVGASGNPNGRPKGARNKRDEEIFSRLEARGDKDPAELLSEIVSSETEPKELRVQAANFLMPFKYGKRGVIPVARFIPEQLEVPTFNTVQEAEAYLAHIPALLGRGELDSQTALELSTLTKNWLDAIYARQDYELKLTAQGGGADITIRIEGGLPPLPGTNVIMDETAVGISNGHNGRAINGQGAGPVIDHQEPPALTESVPSEAGDA